MSMAVTVAFDVYGTLIDTHGVVRALEQFAGNDAMHFSRAWREKQLEYSFRRGLMADYENFSECTRQALDYVCLQYKVPLTEQQKQELLAIYRELPAFDDVPAGLSHARSAGFNLYAFSNGTAQAVHGLLNHAGLGYYFREVVSVDEVRSFKPSPVVYEHFLQRSASSAANTWLVSSNPFDVLGAMAVGMRTAWVQRTPDSLFDPWNRQPTIVIDSLAGLADKMNEVLK